MKTDPLSLSNRLQKQETRIHQEQELQSSKLATLEIQKIAQAGKTDHIPRASLALFMAYEKEAARSSSIPLDILPGIYGEFAQEVVNVHKSPENYLVGGILAAISTAIGANLKIKSARMQTSANLWLMLVGDSGTGKSPLLDICLKPIHEQHMRLDTAFRKLVKMQKDYPEQFKAKPIRRAVLTKGGSIEGMMKTMESAKRGLLMHKDELSSLLKFNKYSSGHGDEKEMYLSLWGRQDLYLERRKEADNYNLVEPFLTIVGNIPTKVARTEFDKVGIWDGFLWRFLPCIYTEHRQRVVGYDSQELETKDKYQAAILEIFDWYEHLNPIKVNEETDQEYIETKVLRLTKDADHLYTDWINYCAFRQYNSETSSTREIIGKIEQQCLRLALVLHVAEQGPASETDQVEIGTIRQAIRLCEYFLQACQAMVQEILKQEIVTKAYEIQDISPKYIELYKMLPEISFSRSQAQDINKELGILSRASLDRFLGNTDYFKPTGKRGEYIKLRTI